MSDTSGLTPRERVFVSEFLVDNDASKAALRAGFTLNSLESGDPTPAEILVRPHVASAIAVAREQRASRISAQRDTYLFEMSLLAMSSLDHYTFDEDGYVLLAEGAPQGAIRALQSVRRRCITRTDAQGNTTRTVETELKLWDKVQPLRLLGREVGLFTDRLEHTGNINASITVDVSKMSNEELKARALQLAAQADEINDTEGIIDLEKADTNGLTGSN